MKKVVAIFLLFTILLSSNSLSCVALDNTSKKNEYTYKVTPESLQWKEFNSHQEMVDACQIPYDEIEKMTTEELISAYLNYPLLGDMYAYSSMEIGFNAMRNQCNALNELLYREDIGEVLLTEYEGAELYNSITVQDATFNDFFKPSVLEILASQPEVISNMDSLVSEALEAAIYKKCAEKPSDIYGATKNSYSIPKPDTESEFAVIKDNSLYIANSIRSISISTSDFNWNYSVKTPNNTSVQVGVLKSGKELTSSEKTICNNYVETAYPGATFVSTATKKYNCHSYAWYSQSTSNGYWMDSPAAYMSDGSYTKSGIKVGNIICYGNEEHSGVVSLVKVGYSGCYVKSKWGFYGLYNHYYNLCPYSTSNLTYWSSK